ncbi:GNAT family N-acetyltransferase [Streptosporangium sp. NPDC002544]|uniref:GNAT family N-acetyltransferase n=1 Tax=Streptosporangium sp. NPDC002544 TaxID=3154538 RepID=UPI00332A87A0
MSAAPAHRAAGAAGAARHEIRLVRAGQVRPFLPAVADVGGQVFTRPPWCEPYPSARGVAARLLADSRRPGFVLAIAVDGDGDDEVCGFAYGVSCSRLATLTCGQPHDDFTLRELGVLPHCRGRGLGAVLHDSVLAMKGDGPAWLTTHSAATTALGLYRRRGWRSVMLHEQAGATRLIMRRPPSWPASHREGRT